jgi:hypothetical protein
MPKYYKNTDSTQVVTQVLRVAGGADKYKILSESVIEWSDSLPDGLTEISEEEYRIIGDAINVIRANNA